jgi:acetyl-CoA synthetase
VTENRRAGYTWIPTEEYVADANVTRLARAHGIVSLAELRARSPFAPSAVYRVRQLPKTRSAKIMRRAVRAAVIGADPGDLSGAENPGAIAEIPALVRQ